MSDIKLFEDKKIRSHYDEESEKWFFSVVDVVGILSESENPRKYWSVLKTRLKNEGSEMATNCSQLKLKATDGKYYLTDVADAEQLLRLIQSVPSPKAEPFKLWLAKVGYERIQDMSDPSLSVDRVSEAELIFTALAEMSTRQIAEVDEAKGLEENAKAGKKGGGIAKKARMELEDKTGKSIVTGENFLPPKKEG